MVLLQISEPGQMPPAAKQKLAVGIDLGTTNTLLATVQDGSANVLADCDGRHSMPSVVDFVANGDTLVGHEALAQAHIPKGCEHSAIHSVKRLMGRGVKDVAQVAGCMPYALADHEGLARLKTCQGDKTPVEVSSLLLKTIVSRLPDPDALSGAVITVPAYFDEAQRAATRDAARLAGIDVLRLLNEPTAAAIAYGLDQGKDETVAVFDLGGGTFDISILKLDRGVFKVLATGGDSALGGDDFDRLIAEHWIEQVPEIKERGSVRALMLAARRLREGLSQAERVDLEWSGTVLHLDRPTLFALTDSLIDRALSACAATLSDAATNVDTVVLVGGATRMPRVREKVATFFDRPVLSDIDPDQVVAIGAALQADVLVGNRQADDMLLLDVLPLSLGLETMGGLVEKVISRNSPIPIVKQQEFTTAKDGQTALLIHVLQGERELVDDCRSLARFELRGIPPMVAGAARVAVTFRVDADGLLEVSASEAVTGTTTSIEVKPSYGLSEEEMTQMIKASYENADHDMQARILREAQVAAQAAVDALRGAIAADGDLLEVSEKEALEGQMALIMNDSVQEVADDLDRQVSELNRLAEDFAHRRMNRSIAQVLSGANVNDLEA